MDILGAIATLIALGVAPLFGVHHLFLQAVGNISTSGSAMWMKMRTWYIITAAQHVVRYLAICIAIHLGLLIAAFTLALAESNTWSTLKPLVATTLVAVVAEALLLLWQLPAIPRFIPGRYPEYLANAAGHLLGKDGRPLLVNGQPVMMQEGIPTDANGNEVPHDQLLRHPEAGRRRRDDAAFHPERLQTGWSFVVTVIAFCVNASVTAWVAGTLESVAILLLYGANILMAFVPIRIVSALVAWAMERGISLMEFAGTLGIKQILPLAVGITVQNSPRMEIANQEELKRKINVYTKAITQNMLLVSLWVLIVTSTQTLAIVPLIIVVIGISSFLFSEAGGKWIVKDRHFRLMNWNSIVAPTVGILTIGYRYLPNVGMGGAFKLFILEKWHQLFYGVILGTSPLDVGSGWRTLGLLLFTGLIATIAISVAKDAEGMLKKVSRFAGTLAALFALFYTYELGHIIAEKPAMRVPWGVSEAFASELEATRAKTYEEKKRQVENAGRNEAAWNKATKQVVLVGRRTYVMDGTALAQQTHDVVRITMPDLDVHLPPPPPPPATEEKPPAAKSAATPTPKTTMQASSPAKPRGCTPKRIALYKRFHNGAAPPGCL